MSSKLSGIEIQPSQGNIQQSQRAIELTQKWRLLLNCMLYCTLSFQTKYPNLRTTMPLVSYIRNSLRFWYYASLSTCFQNLEKKLRSPENLGESGVKLLRDLTEKSVNFSTLATSNIRLLLVFGEEDQ